MRTWFCLALAMVFLCAGAEAQIPQKQVSESGLKYMVREARGNSAGKPPVLILLHGLGSNEDDLFSLADRLPSRFMVVSVRAPYTLGPDSYAWYHFDRSGQKVAYDVAEAEKSRQTLVRFIKELNIRHSIDPNQVYLGGFSQGGILSYSVGLTHPELLKGIVVLSGRLLDEIRSKVVAKDKLSNLRIFISHGTRDEVLPISNARSAHAFLQNLGLQPTYHEYPEGHSLNAGMLADWLNWLDR